MFSLPQCSRSLCSRVKDDVAPSGLFCLGGFGLGDIAKRCSYILLIISVLGDWSYPFACLVLRAVAATAIFVALGAGALAGQKDARNERPYIYSPDFLFVVVR